MPDHHSGQGVTVGVEHPVISRVITGSVLLLHETLLDRTEKELLRVTLASGIVEPNRGKKDEKERDSLSGRKKVTMRRVASLTRVSGHVCTTDGNNSTTSMVSAGCVPGWVQWWVLYHLGRVG